MSDEIFIEHYEMYERKYLLARSNPLASRPNQRSSIHQAIVLWMYQKYHRFENKVVLPRAISALPPSLGQNHIAAKTYPAWLRLKLRGSEHYINEQYGPRKGKTYVHKAYKNPQKQNAAINIRTRNCIIIARRERTMRLFFRVTNASLPTYMLSKSHKCISDLFRPWEKETSN